MARSASTERSWESTSAARSAMPPVMYASRACWASRPSVRLISVCTSASEAAAWRRFSRAVASRLRACSRRASARETSSLALVSAIDRALASARASRSTPSMLLSWSWVRERSSCSPTTPRPWTCARSPATGTTSWAPCSLSRPGSTSTAATPKWSCGTLQLSPAGEGVVDQQYPAPVEAGGHLEGVVAVRKVPCRSSTSNQLLFVVAGHARHHADGPHEWMTTRTAFARRHGRDRFPMADALAVLVDESREQRRDSRKKSRPEFLGTVLVAAEEVMDGHQGGSVQAELHRRIEELVDGFDDGGARPLRISLRPLLLQDE